MSIHRTFLKKSRNLFYPLLLYVLIPLLPFPLSPKPILSPSSTSCSPFSKLEHVRCLPLPEIRSPSLSLSLPRSVTAMRKWSSSEEAARKGPQPTWPGTISSPRPPRAGKEEQRLLLLSSVLSPRPRCRKRKRQREVLGRPKREREREGGKDQHTPSLMTIVFSLFLLPPPLFCEKPSPLSLSTHGHTGQSCRWGGGGQILPWRGVIKMASWGAYGG